MLPYAWLDRWVARHPFEGRMAWRYARLERPAFGDLDERLLDMLGPELARATRFLDLGAGNHELSVRLAAERPRLTVIAVEPSVAYTRARRAGVLTVRSLAERLPLGDACIDVGVCFSSLRHVRDRGAALRELRRVIRPEGSLCVVELDPRADRLRSERHRRALQSPLARFAFDPLLLRTCPTAEEMCDLAHASGWRSVERDVDPWQPVYLLRLR